MACTDILVITFNNPQYLYPCIDSLMTMVNLDIARLIIVNNGETGSVQISHPGIKVVDAGRNLGWEGGLKLGLQHSTAPFVCFLNDDTFFPPSEAFWLTKLLQHFRNPAVVGVGPSSNKIMGVQNIWAKTPNVMSVRFLIGLCFLLRRDALEACGGVDDTLPGGDDIDLSIRLRQKGGILIADKNVFVYHHYGTTGTRVHSDWDSIRHQEAYKKALWEKHTLKEYLQTSWGQVVTDGSEFAVKEDVEGDMVRRHAKGEKIYDLGCGDQITVEGSIGVDIVPKGTPMGGMVNRFSKADIVANVFEPLPFEGADCLIARHNLEHNHDPINTILNWKRALKPHGGRLIIAVPDEARGNMIPLNPEHKAAFTKDSLRRLMETLGMHTISIEDSGNNISIVGVFERNSN